MSLPSRQHSQLSRAWLRNYQDSDAEDAEFLPVWEAAPYPYQKTKQNNDIVQLVELLSEDSFLIKEPGTWKRLISPLLSLDLELHCDLTVEQKDSHLHHQYRGWITLICIAQQLCDLRDVTEILCSLLILGMIKINSYFSQHHVKCLTETAWEFNIGSLIRRKQPIISGKVWYLE